MIDAGAIQIVAGGMPAELGVIVGGTAHVLPFGCFVGLAFQDGDEVVHRMDMSGPRGTTYCGSFSV